MITHRLLYAKKYLEDAMELFREERYNSAVSRLYYASYQAMWAALGDPPEGYWKHLSLIKQFVKGRWLGTEHRPDSAGLLEDKHLPLRKLYSHRIRSDYDAEKIAKEEVEPLLGMLKELIDIIDKKRINIL